MKKIIFVLIAAFVLLCCVGGAGFYFKIYSHTGSKHTEKLKPILFAQIKNLVVSVPQNSESPSNQVYVELSVQFATTDQKAISSFNNLLPIIQAKIISMLMEKQAVQLMDPKTHQDLSKNLLFIANEVLEKNDGFSMGGPFSAAYITNIVEQD